jgi:hypothetical protein
MQLDGCICVLFVHEVDKLPAVIPNHREERLDQTFCRSFRCWCGRPGWRRTDDQDRPKVETAERLSGAYRALP